ncbi:hypothetical protein NNQ28_22465 (plasmid) [Cronobacter dublinensis]|uniref:hypothetical protein n=1 Tax=Cronobacter dublinensis TaxID=413497 RepID=UPI00292D75AE|nr:hypothetical protein [Cronobacter dublinensis]WNY85046.1 hypothetical protein NNQ28_22465 [Cronobacter dublinensis]
MHNLLELISNLLIYWPFSLSRTPAQEKNAVTGLKYQPLFTVPSDDPRLKKTKDTPAE